MKFWQAVVTAQMAAGSVWADARIPHGWWHIGAEMIALLFGAGLWAVGRWYETMTRKEALR